MFRSQVITERLDLIAGTAELVEAELHGLVRFAEALQARVPADWPPPLNDRSTMQWCLRYFHKHTASEGWVNWYFVLRGDKHGERVVIGNGGFRGLPAADGTVEIGYSIIPAFQGVGYATEAVAALTEWVFRHAEVKRIIAETYLNLTKSIGVMKKNGFQFIGRGSGPGIVRYERVP